MIVNVENNYIDLFEVETVSPIQGDSFSIGMKSGSKIYIHLSKNEKSDNELIRQNFIKEWNQNNFTFSEIKKITA